MKENSLNFDKRQMLVIVVIFLISISLRLGVAIYNRQANDPHMPVIRYILREGALPEKPDCHECFQPKFFHFAAAKVLSALRLDQSRDADAQIIAVQLMNFLMGVGVLLVSWIFIRGLTDIPGWIRILGFALLALNPQMIGINSQVTNDTFLILFCVTAVYGAYRVLYGGGPAFFLLTVFFSFLAVITKTNGWVVVIAIALAFFCGLLSAPDLRSSKMPFYAVLFPLLVVGLATVSPLSQYVNNYRDYGSPLVISIERQPPPSIFIETYTPYAGILSVQDGFFTFKFTDLIKNPVTDLKDQVDDTSHRTSLWTRLYGSANSLHFENYPPSWRETGESAGQALFVLYRGIFILALLPALVTFAGAGMEIYATVKGMLTKNSAALRDVSYGLFAFLFVGYVLFIVLYAFEYRVYAVMKAVFVFPGILAYVVFFVKGASWIAARSTKWAVGFAAWIAALLILYVVDVSSLIIQLLPNGSGIGLIVESLIRNWG